MDYGTCTLTCVHMKFKQQNIEIPGIIWAGLKKTMDNIYGYDPGTTKTIQSKLLPDLDLKDVDDETTRLWVSTKIFKVLNDVEYKVSITGNDHKKKLYHNIYEDEYA